MPTPVSNATSFEQIREESTTFVDNNDRIAFENIQVYTPTGHLLVKDLNFAFDSGTNMLLTGCNGSGKSSIFRCLGALWKVKDGGTITKPGGLSAPVYRRVRAHVCSSLHACLHTC